MPISIRQLQREVNCSGRSLGDVRLSSATIAKVQAALNIARKESEGSQAASFANHLLATMIVAPPKSDEDIAELSDEGIAPLMVCVADLLGVSKEFEDLSDDIPPRERLYRAYNNYYDQVMKGLMRAFRPAFPESTLGFLDNAGLFSSMKVLPSNTGISDEILSSLKQMNRINFKLLQPSLPVDLFGLTSQVKAFQDVASSFDLVTGKTLAALTQGLIDVKLPEPFLSTALITSGLNSPLIHTSAYQFPEFEPIETEGELEERAEDALHRRIVDAYDSLLALETGLRELIRALLSEHWGIAWWRQSIPPKVRKDCQERKAQRETPDGLVNDPIDYTFIGDLKDIIMKGDNWNPVFQPVFGNKTELEAVFMWIEPVRKDIAHSRPSSDDEYQQFIVAVNWIQRAIGRALR